MGKGTTVTTEDVRDKQRALRKAEREYREAVSACDETRAVLEMRVREAYAGKCVDTEGGVMKVTDVRICGGDVTLRGAHAGNFRGMMTLQREAEMTFSMSGVDLESGRIANVNLTSEERFMERLREIMGTLTELLLKGGADTSSPKAEGGTD